MSQLFNRPLLRFTTEHSIPSAAIAKRRLRAALPANRALVETHPDDQKRLLAGLLQEDGYTQERRRS